MVDHRIRRGTSELSFPGGQPSPSPIQRTPAPILTTPSPQLDLPAYTTRRDNTQVASTQGNAQLNLDFFPISNTAYGSMEAHFQLEDRDGLDEKSKADLHGQLDLNLEISRQFLSDSLKEANREVPDLDFTLRTTRSGYRIDVDYPTRLGDIGLGSIYLRPDGDSIKLEAGGFAGGAAKVINFLSLGYARKAVQSLVDSLSDNMGFKATANSATDYTLRPDLKNSPLFERIPLAGGESLKLEQVRTGNSGLVDISVDSAGNLRMNMQNLQVVASSGTGSRRAVADAEGPDSMDVKVQAELQRDWTLNVETLMDLDLNVQSDEREALQARLKNIVGQDLPLSGQLKLEDLAVNARLKRQGQNFQLQEMNATGGTLSAESLNVDMQGTEVNLRDVEGDLQMQQRNGETRLQTQDVELKGQITSPQGSLNIDELNFSGSMVHNAARPNQLRFELNRNQPLEFNGRVQQGRQEIGIRDLSLQNAVFETDLQQGTLSMSGENGSTPEARVKRLALPGVTLNEIRLKGELEAHLQNGHIQVDAEAFGTAARMGDVTLNWLQASGNIEIDANGGLELSNGRFSAVAEAPGVKIEKLSGRGELRMQPNGNVYLDEVRNLELETSLGLDVKGDFRGQIEGNDYHFETLGDRSAEVSFVDESQGIELRDMQVKGLMDFNAQTEEVSLASKPGAWMEMSSGQIQGLELKDIRLQGAFRLNAREMTFMPGEDGTLRGSGQLDTLRLEDIEAQGPIHYDMHKQIASWSDPATLSLPQHNIHNIQTEGPISIETRPSGEMVFRSDGGQFSAQLGDVNIQDLELRGEVVFDPSTQRIEFHGPEGEPLSVNGTFNGYPLNLAASGQLDIEQSAESVRIVGEDIRVDGLIDGFTLSSPEGMRGAIAVKPDFSSFDLEDLHFAFAVDDIAVDSAGSVRSTPEGLVVSLDGTFDSSRDDVRALLSKLSGRSDLGDAGQATARQVTQLLDQAFSDYDSAAVNFENLELTLDNSMRLKDFSLQSTAVIEGAETELEMFGRGKDLPLGRVEWQADVSGSASDVSIPSGEIRMNLNEEMRDAIADQVHNQLKDSGFKDIELEVLPNGNVHIENVSTKRGPINIKAELAISTRIVDNQLEVSLDKVRLKNFLFDAIGRIAGSREMVSDEVDRSLEQQNIKFQRRNRRGHESEDSGHIFRIDLQSMLNQMSPGITLESASLSEQGDIRVTYGYNADD